MPVTNEPHLLLIRQLDLIRTPIFVQFKPSSTRPIQCVRQRCENQFDTCIRIGADKQLSATFLLPP